LKYWVVKENPNYVKTGRKKTKLICNICGFEMLFESVKRDKKISKMKKHIRSHDE